MLIGSRARLSAVAGAAALTLLTGPALADIAVAAARIAEGHLWVIGQSDEPGARITLDDAHESATDRSGRFEFRVIHHPATCIVTLKTATQSQRAVVAGCGQAGPKGEAGVAGPPGRPGPPGPAAVAVAEPSTAAAPTAPTRSAASTQATPGPATSALLVARPPESTQSLPATPPIAPAELPRPRPSPVAVPAAPPAPPVSGEWLDADGKAKINIQPCGEAVCGRISWSKEGGELGAQILRTMKPDGPNRWKGTIFNPENGKTYDSSITLQANNTLKVEGCVMGFLCGGQTWTRPR